jgi:hypothetical protein
MKFGIFYEHQLPRPWGDGAELQLFQDALDQVELADRLGIDHAWEVDQTIFIQQGGRNRHEHICEALELFAAEVMPEFHEREAEREQRKREELAPYVEAAMKRKPAMPAPADHEIPVYEAYGNTVALSDEDIQKMPEGNRRRVQTFRKIREIADHA